MANNSSANLLLRFYEQGDKKALEHFFFQNFDFIYRIAYYYTKNKADTEDVCQQVIAKILTSKARCEAAYNNSDKEINSWVGVLTANQAKMFLRKEKRRINRETKKGETMKLEDQSNLQFRSNKNEGDGDEIKNALTLIPVKYKDIIMLK